MSWSTSELRVRLAPLNRFKPSSKIFYWPFQGGTSFVDLLCFCSVLCLLCLCARLFICALWSPAGKGLTSWLSFVVSYCEFVTFPLVSWVRCGTWLYRFLILAPLLTQQCGNVSPTLRRAIWPGPTPFAPAYLSPKIEVLLAPVIFHQKASMTWKYHKHCRPTHGAMRKRHRTLQNSHNTTGR